MDGEKPSTSKDKTVKEEVVDEVKKDSKFSSNVIWLEKEECDKQEQETGEANDTNGASTSSSSENSSKDSNEKCVENTRASTDKLPFVEETILDEFSLMLFTCLSDAQVFEKELDAVRAREELEKKRIAAEKAVRIEKLKRKIRSKKRLVEKALRLQRKRLRGQKREKLRRERKSRHSQLKKTIRDAKAIQKAAAAAGQVVVVDKELKKQWKSALEAAARRREEKAKRRVEHETRREARRAKREKKRGRKRRDPNKATNTKKGKDALTTTTTTTTTVAVASVGSAATPTTVGSSLITGTKLSKASRGRKMKSPGVLVDTSGTTTAPLKRGASQTPSPAPMKTSRIEPDTAVFRNGIIGIAKSDSSATCTPSIPLGVLTPPGAANQTPRTPLSAESKPHTTSAESSHPSDPGHRASSVTPSATTVGGTNVSNPASSLFVNTSSASLLTQAGLLSHQLAATQQLGIDPLSLIHI